MTRDNAYNLARLTALKSKVDIVVVNDPLANAEDGGPYGFAPRAAVDTLFPHRDKSLDYYIEPAGGYKLFEYTAKELASWAKGATK